MSEVPNHQIRQELARRLSVAAGCPDTCSRETCACEAQADAIMNAYWVVKRRSPTEKKGNYRFFTGPEIKRLEVMLNDGMTLREAANELARCYQSIHAKALWLKRRGRVENIRLNPNVKADMTQRQKQALDYIRSFWAEHGYAPTYLMVAKSLGLKGTAGAARIIHALVQDGYLTMSPKRARTIRPVELRPGVNV